MALEPAQPAGVGRRGDDDVVGRERRAVVGRQANAAGPPLDRPDPGVLVDRDPALLADAGKPADELRRVEDHVATRRLVEPGQPERRVDLGLDRVAIEEHELLAVLGRLVDPGPELLDLVGLVGDAQAAGLLEVAVDAVRPGEGDEGREVRDALLLEPLDLVGEVADPVGQAVGQRRLAEPAVPAATPRTRRSPARGRRPAATDPCRSGRCAVHRPVNPAADDRDVGDGRAAQRRAHRPGRRRAEPVADRGRRIGRDVVVGHRRIVARTASPSVIVA